MKQRIFSGIAATLCALTLVCPITAQAKAPNDEGDASVQVEETKWYYRNNNGVEEKRLWSLVEGRWLTAWIPV